MTIEEHAKAISEAIDAAFGDGYELDNGSGSPIFEMDLNSVVAGTISDWVAIELPKSTYY
ncbi:hypothetical protein ACFYY2_12350 [Streptomyces sp. NPDC001822]|uniref:hypothetical protein n=1 Tax=Streptomyces sp. NPDC001822 TaxID=3364614 RepID=UPI0036C6C72B